MTLENFASLLDICVSDGGDSPAIKLSSDETMAYIYNGGGPTLINETAYLLRITIYTLKHLHGYMVLMI